MTTVAGATHAATRRQCRCVATVRKAGPATLPPRPARRLMLCRRTLAGLPGGAGRGGRRRQLQHCKVTAGDPTPSSLPREASAVRPPPLHPLPSLAPLPCPYPSNAHTPRAYPAPHPRPAPASPSLSAASSMYTLYTIHSALANYPPLIIPPQITSNQLRHLAPPHPHHPLVPPLPSSSLFILSPTI